MLIIFPVYYLKRASGIRFSPRLGRFCFFVIKFNFIGPELPAMFFNIIYLTSRINTPEIIADKLLDITQIFLAFCQDKIFPELSCIITIRYWIVIIYEHISYAIVIEIKFIHLGNFFPEISAEAG